MLAGGVLADDHLLELRDGSFVRVGDVLDAPERFDRVSLPDPIEGRPYGPDKATLLLNPDPRRPDIGPRLVSHAHGARTVYRFARYEPAAQPAGPVLRPAKDRPDVLEPEEARNRLRAEVRDGLRRPGVTMIEATLGLGKTAAAIAEMETLLQEAKAAGIEDPAVAFAVPMHKLGRQVLQDVQTQAPGLAVVQIYGAEAQDPDNPEETVCKRLDEYREHRALMLDTADLCKTCPHSADCLHITSTAARGEIYITAHERLKAAKTPLKAGQKLIATIIDESPYNALVSATSRAMPVARMMASPARIRARASEAELAAQEADLRKFRAMLKATIEAHGPGPLQLEKLTDWTASKAGQARALEMKRKIENTKHPEVKGNLTLAALHGVYGEIRRSIEEAIPHNARLVIRDGDHGPEVMLSGLKPIGEGYRTTPIVMLDATANAELVAKLAGGPVTHHATIRARENLTIEQDPNLSGAKSFFFAKNKPTGNVVKVKRYLVALASQGPTAVIGNKDTVAAMDIPPHIGRAHFNALRGLNDLAHVDTLVIVGRTLPSEAALERHVWAVFGTPVTGRLDHKGTAWRAVLQDGKVMEAATKAATHPDAWVEMILAQIRDSEVMQAVGRLRAVNRSTPARCILLSDAVIDAPIQLADLRPSLRACGVLGEMLEAGGVAFLSPSHAAVAYPQIYASEQAARFVLKPILDCPRFSIRDIYGKSWAVVSVTRPRARGASLALLDGSVLDPEEAIKRLIPDAVVTAPDPQEASEPTPEPVQPSEPVDLGKVRRARADRQVDALFDKTLMAAMQILEDFMPLRQARKVVNGPPVPVARKMLWLQSSPAPRRHPLRRYQVLPDDVVLIWDKAADDAREAAAIEGAREARAIVSAWQHMTPENPEAWV